VALENTEMPLRDHFHPPITTRHSWEGFHASWPLMLVARLFPHLPPGYSAEPRVRLGTYYELDVGTFENEPSASESGGVATLSLTAPTPSQVIDVDIGEQFEYEVLVFDLNRDRQIVAAVEFVSPANKDRSEHRKAFASKCATLLQKGICVTIVDPVTTRHANLYQELLELLDRSDSSLGDDPPSTYAVTCRGRKAGRPRLETWFHPMNLGQPLPEPPLWLTEELFVPLELEASYEETCRILRIA
jgi:hypothetical protein